MENNNLEKVEKEYWGKSFYGSKLNTVLLLILIVLMVFALRFMYQNQGEYLPDLDNTKLESTEQNEIKTNVEEINQNGIQIDENNFNNKEKNEVGWVKSQTFGLYYPESFNPPSEFYKKNNAVVHEPSGDTVPVFSLIFNNGKSAITWGDVWLGGYIPGTCTQSDFGIFEYGVSSVACVKGYRTWVARFSARDTVMVDDLKIFGDFVLKNK